LGQDVWVLTEHRGGELEEVTKEMLAEASDLKSKLAGQVCSLLLGDGLAKLAIPLAHYGADLVYMAEHPLLSSYTTDAYTDVISGLIQQYQPAILICGATPNGRDLAPRLATRLGVNLASDCMNLGLSGDGQLIATKPAYQDKLYAKVLYPAAGLLIATFCPGVRGVNEADMSRRCEVVPVPVTISSEQIRTRCLGVIPADPRTVDVSEAESIVAGGRGVGDNFPSLWELADLLGAAIGGTRVAVDRGWLPLERLIGATGKTVKPRLYLACGISGATQHSIGMKDSETVIAINMDRTAPIFSLADLGVLGDLNQVIPALIRRLRQQRDRE
jgi:electron transfer flavoprotein alpha subunit